MPRHRFRMRMPAAALGLVLALLAGAGVVSQARAAGRPTHLTVRWHLVGRYAYATNGRVTALPWFAAGGRTPKGLRLIDERRPNRERRIPVPAWCRSARGAAPFGHPGVVLRCGRDRLALFSLDRRRWQSLALHGPCRRTIANCDLDDIGQRWISYYVSGDDSGYYAENIATGTVRKEPSKSGFIIDLDSPILVRRPCPAVRHPLDGTLEAHGRYVLASENEGDTILYRCGSDRHELTSEGGLPTSFGPGVVAFSPTGTSIGVLTLDGLRRFEIARPARRAAVFSVQWTRSRLYATTYNRRGDIRVWSAATPTLPGATSPAPR